MKTCDNEMQNSEGQLNISKMTNQGHFSKEPDHSVLIFMGSHRRQKNTGVFAQKLMDVLNEKQVRFKFIDINDLTVAHCTDCGYCHRNYGKCVYNDDMTAVYELLKQSKHVIFLSPVYMNNITSKLKVIVDRCQMIFICDYVHKKPFVSDFPRGKGFIVSIGGPKGYKDQFYGSELTLALIFRILRLPLVEHIKFGGTDYIQLSDRSQEVESAVNTIVNEVIDNES